MGVSVSRCVSPRLSVWHRLQTDFELAGELEVSVCVVRPAGVLAVTVHRVRRLPAPGGGAGSRAVRVKLQVPGTQAGLQQTTVRGGVRGGGVGMAETFIHGKFMWLFGGHVRVCKTGSGDHMSLQIRGT